MPINLLLRIIQSTACTPVQTCTRSIVPRRLCTSTSIAKHKTLPTHYSCTAATYSTINGMTVVFRTYSVLLLVGISYSIISCSSTRTTVDRTPNGTSANIQLDVPTCAIHAALYCTSCSTTRSSIVRYRGGGLRSRYGTRSSTVPGVPAGYRILDPACSLHAPCSLQPGSAGGQIHRIQCG